MTKKKKTNEKTVHLKAVAPVDKPADTPFANVLAVPQAAVVKPAVASVAAKVAKTPTAAPDLNTKVKKQELIDRVVAASGEKKSVVKPVVEATLKVLSDALLEGEAMQLPPLGKLKVQNDKDIGGGVHALTLKLRTPKQD